MILLSSISTAQNQPELQPAPVKSMREWNRLRSHARTASDFRRLAQWCQTQVDLNDKKVAVYQTELREYYASPSAHPHPKNPPADLTLKNQIAHCQDLSRRWTSLAIQMNSKLEEADRSSAQK